jgi:hypothetical protein
VIHLVHGPAGRGTKVQAQIVGGGPLYDVSYRGSSGRGARRSVADIRALESAAAPSRVANSVYGLRHLLGGVFGWDHVQIRPEDSLLSRLSERDRRDSEIPPGTPVGSFLLLYQFPSEALSETRNATVHGYVCTAFGAHGERVPSVLGGYT